MIKMHLKSGEEGGTRKALEYIELMENHNLFPSRQLMRQIRQIADDAAYTRDMKRRARRMQQAKEEHHHQKESARKYPPTENDFEGENTAFDPIHPFSPRDMASIKGYVSDSGMKKSQIDEYFRNTEKSIHDIDDLPPLTSTEPLEENNLHANFWDRWKENSISKHDLYEDIGIDGNPRGETFAEKNDALQKLGITSKFPTHGSLPRPSDHKLLPLLRKGGTDPTGALWAIDGSGFSYPSARKGAFGWDVTFWRERQIIKKAFDQAVSSGNLSWIRNVPSSIPTLTHKTIPEQLEIEQTKCYTDGDMRDASEYPLERYDSGALKPVSERAAAVIPRDTYAWEKEKDNFLVPFMSEKEIVDEMGYENEIGHIETDTLGLMNQKHTNALNQQTMETLRSAPTDMIAYESSNGMGEQQVSGYKNRKFDYLRRFKDMYQRGQLEVPDEPLLRFGRTASDVKSSTAASVEAFYNANESTKGYNEENRGGPVSERAVMKRKLRRHFSALRLKNLRKKGIRRKPFVADVAKAESHEK